jgi:hypothetical protein
VRFCFARAFSFHWRTGLSFVRAGGSLEQMACGEQHNVLLSVAKVGKGLKK